MKEIKLETKCPKCEHVFLTTFEESEPTPSDPENVAKLQEDHDKLEVEVANLQEEVARLESEEHGQEVIRHFLNNLDSADPVAKADLAIKLGLVKMVEEAEVAEEKEPGAETKEPGYIAQVAEFLKRPAK